MNKTPTMKKIIKQIGFEGRTTIPQIIREAMGLEDGDFISFEISEDKNSVTIRKEFICDGCMSESEEVDDPLMSGLNGLDPKDLPVPQILSIMKTILELVGDAA